MKKYKYVCLFLLVTCLIIGLGSVTAAETNTTDTQKTVTDTNTQNTIKTIQNTAQTQENDNNKASKEVVKTNIEIKENKTEETKEKIKQIQTNKNNKKTIKQTATTVNVNNYEELRNNINNATTESITINLNKGTYINTETITLNKQTCKHIIIFGNNQTIQGNKKQFLYINNGFTVTVNNLTVTNCSANNGGTIYNNGNLSIFNSNMTKNMAYAGTIYNHNNGCITLLNTTINNNIVTSNGGAVYNSGNLSIFNSSITKNRALSGIIHNSNNGNITIQNTNMSGNELNKTISISIGIILNNNGTIIINNTTIENSNANNAVIYNYRGNMNISNSRFYNDTCFGNNTLFNGTFKLITNNTYIANYLETTSNTPSNVTTELTDYNIKIPVTTREIYNTTVNNGNFTVFINGVEYKKFAVKNGISNITIPLNAFSRTVNNITYNYTSPDKSYQPLTLKNTITLKKHNTTLTVNKINNQLFDNKINITGTLKDKNNTMIKNAAISVTVNGRTYNTTTNNKGEYSLTQATAKLGTNNITVNFNGNNLYNSSKANTTSMGLKHNTTITINKISDTSFDNRVNITGTLKDINGTAISNATVTVNNINVTTDFNGGFVTQVNANLGVNNVTVKFNGNTHYNKSEKTMTFRLSHNTTLTIDQIPDTPFDNKVNITGKLTDINGTILSNKTVTVNINDKIYNTTTNDTGEYIVESITVLLNTNNVTVSYAGDDQYNNITNTTTFNGLKHEVLINIDEEVPFDSNMTGTLKDVNGTVIPYAWIELVNEDRIIVVTNSTGGFTLPIKINLGNNYLKDISPYKGLVYPINYIYPDKNKYEKEYIDFGTSEINVIGLPHNTTITIDQIPDTPFDNNVNATGILKDANGTSISNATVTVNNINITTDINGIFTAQINANPGVNNVTVKFDGNDYYNKAEETMTFNGLLHNTTITVNPVNNTLWDNKVNITGKLSDIDGTILSNKTVTVNINDKKYNAITNNTGEYIVENITVQPNTNNVTVIYVGDAQYNNITNTTTFNGLKHEVVINIDEKILFDSNMTGTLKDVNGTIIPNATINFMGETIGVMEIVTNTSGEFILPIKVKCGDNYLNKTNYTGLFYPGDSKYERSSLTFFNSTINIIGLPHDTAITVNPVNNTLWDNKVNVTGTLKDTNGTAISNVIVTVNDINVTTDANGIFTAQINADFGVNNITVKFNGNNYYNKAEKIMTFKGLPHNTTITIDQIQDTAFDNKVNVTGTLKDMNGTTITNVIVTVNDINVTTDADGIFTTQVNANYGINNVSVKFDGNNHYNKAEETITFNGIPHNIAITINPIPDTPFNNKVNITGTLKDTNGTSISNVTVTINDINVTTDANGIFTAQINVDFGVNNITVKFNGNNYYNKAEKIMTFKGLPHNTTITIDQIQDTAFDNKVNVTGTLKDMNGTIISNTIVTVNDINVTTDANGRFITEINVNPGINSITVKFDGNNHYNKAEETMTFKGLPHNTTITIDQIQDTVFDNEVNVTGTLKDTNGTTISNVTVTINNINVTTDANGIFTTQINANPGINNIIVKFNGNTNYNKSEKTMTFKGLLHNTTITVNPIPDTPFDNKVNVTGTLNDTNGTIISNTIVTVNDINVTTDANGRFTTQINVNPRINSITVKFDGNNHYNKAEETMTFKGLPHNTTITANPIPDTPFDNKVNVTGTLKDTNGTAISNATINIKINDKEHNTITNNKGEYSLIVQAIPGLNNITVNYNGNSTYNKSRATTSFSGVKHKTNTSIDPVKGLLGKNVTFKAYVTDINGTRVNEGYVIFKVNGITLKDKSDNPIRVNVTDGTATLITIATWGKANNTTASYSGNEKYKASKADGTINITRQNVTVNLTIQNNGLKPGETLVAIVNVTDMDNKPVHTGNVLFKMNGKTMKYIDGSQVRINVTNGTAILHYQVPVNYSAKNYTLTAVYTGNIYNRAETTTNFTLNKRDAKINMTINSKDLKPGSTLIATANVMDMEGFSVTTGRVAFKINGKLLRYTNGSSIKIAVVNGTAKLNYTIPKDYSAKTYTLTAEFDAGNYNTVETRQIITLSKINTYIQPSNITINGNKLTVKANIMNNYTKDVASERKNTVSIKLDKHTVIKEVTVNNGVINLSTNVNVKPGVHTVEIVTSGNGIYNSCRQNFTINNQTLFTNNDNNLIKVIECF